MNAAPSPRTSLWVLRLTTVATAALVGMALSSAADGRAGGAGLPATIAWWLVVAISVVALIVPGALGLSAVRMVAPLGATAAGAALVAGADAAVGVPTLALGLVSVAVAFSAEAGEAMVQGAAYGDEHRFPLRIPAAFLLPVAVSWLLWAGAGTAGVLLLGGRVWVPGGLLVAFAAAVAWPLLGRLHRFARRWLVVVPAGVVVHDHVVLAETLMVPKANVRRCGLALADTQAADLTGPAAGHAIEITVGEMVTPLFAVTRAQPKGRAIYAAAFLVAPSRPGRALRALAAAKLPVA